MKLHRQHKRTIDSNGKIVLEINVSTLRLMQSCQRKADYVVNHELTKKYSYHADFGTIVHKFMEDFYSTPKEAKTPERVTDRWTKRYKEYEFVPQDEKKTFETGLAALQKYREMFIDDEYEVIILDGKPAVEYEFQTQIYEDDNYRIILFGTIDMIARHKVTKEFIIMDHKTTGQLGAQFMNRWNPNHQMSGYVIGCRSLGFECDTALIQGIQVVKTKQEIVRITTKRSEEQLQDFIDTIVYEAIRFDKNTTSGKMPGADDLTCAEFSGCDFLAYCQANLSNRMQMIKARQQELKALEEENARSTAELTN